MESIFGQGYLVLRIIDFYVLRKSGHRRSGRIAKPTSVHSPLCGIEKRYSAPYED